MGMSSEREQAERAKREVVLRSGRLRIVLVGLLVVFLLAGMVHAAQELFGVQSGGADVARAVGTTSALLSLAGGGLAACVVIRMLADAASSQSLFSEAQAKRLFAVGVLFLVSAALRVFSAAALFASSGSQGQFGFVCNDILFIIAAIVSFYFSNVLRYGHFLQWLYDETV